jgi:hypothetical protein
MRFLSRLAKATWEINRAVAPKTSFGCASFGIRVLGEEAWLVFSVERDEPRDDPAVARKQAYEI